MNNCVLCLNKTLKKNSVTLTEEEESGSTIEDIVKQHFWFYELILEYSQSQKQGVVCRTCWEKLEAFHEFFTAIKFNHKATDLEVTEKILNLNPESVYIKDENELEVPEIHEEYLDEFQIKDDQLDVIKSRDSESDDQLDVEEFNNDPRRSSRKRKSLFDLTKPPKKVKTTERRRINKPITLTKDELETLKLHAGDLKCEKCEEIFNDWPGISSHYRHVHKVDGFVRCCKKKLFRAMEIQDHINLHINPNYFQCKTCGKTSISRYNLQLHELVHVPDEERQFACDKCGRKVVNEYNLRMHMKIHAKENLDKTIPCKFCDKKFQTEAQLKSHVNFCHSEKNETFVCHICSKAVKRKATLDAHIQEQHTNPVDPIECTICGHLIKNKRRFYIHMRNHRSENAGPHECEKGCGKLFKNRSSMLGHVAYVHSTNQFPCSFCEKVFKNKDSLKDHEAIHKNVDPYSCPFCDRVFKNSANMHSHKKKAHYEEYKKMPAPSYLGNKTIGEIKGL